MKQQCVFCKSSSIVKNGIRKRKVRRKQSYLCRSCGKQFIEPDGFERMRHKREHVARAIHMHNDGFSLDQVRNHLWQHDGVKVTRQAIWFWNKKYAVFLKSGKQLLAHH